ncbi:UNVERIFIED_CONTAM: 39S ribosomal protein L45, mitochondrial [Siphonaria sp. JEL0065]|nr:39S ribosomal protein L45, mitochondrial [Siphonaria sp. JEL0065]
MLPSLSYHVRTATIQQHLNILQPFRTAATTPMRGTPVMLNIVDPFIPGPFGLSKRGRKNIWDVVKRVPTICLTLYKLKTAKVTVSDFKKDAELLYCSMNEAVARGDKDMLEKVVNTGFASILNPEIKRIKRIGQGQWTHHGPIKIKTIGLATAKVEEEKGKESMYCQINTRITSKQSYALYSHEGKLIGGDPEKYIDMVEYVVFDKKISADGKIGPFKIAGKVAVAAPAKTE